MDSQTALNNLRNYNVASPEQNYGSAANTFGVQGASQAAKGVRGAIQSTSDLLSGVAPGVMGRISNSLVNNAQYNAQVGESAPIQANLAAEPGLGQQLGTDYGALAQKALTQAGNTQQFQQGQQSYLQNIYNDILQREQNAQSQANFERALSKGSYGSLPSLSVG